MKRYLVFTGMTYYPGGGWNDYLTSADTLVDALLAALGDNDWYHIVDTTTGQIIQVGER